MTESDYTVRVIRALRQRLPRAVAFKHADMFTAGVPDFSLTLHRCTNWCEAKKLDARHVRPCPPDRCAIFNPARDVPAIQWETLRRLGRGHLIVYTDFGHAVTHVSGLRESVGELKLRLMTLVELVDRLVTIADQGEKYGESEDW